MAVASRVETAEELTAAPSRAVPRRGETAHPGRLRLTIGVVVAAFVLVQPISIPIAYDATRALSDLPDAHAQWTAYTAGPAPEVLFLGDSETLTDVDVAAVSELLSKSAGRTVTVGKLGLPAETPDVLHALVYRVMQRPSRPRHLVFEINELTLNDYWKWDPNYDLWLLSTPDPGYLRLALEVDPTPNWLLRAWAFPYSATAPLIVRAAQCRVIENARAAFQAAGRGVPLELRAETPCEFVKHYGQLVVGNIDPYFQYYSYSTRREAYVQRSVELARAGGVQVTFIQYPALRLEARGPDAYSTFQGRMAGVASRLAVPSISLVDALDSRPGLFLDDGHLTGSGATAFAPLLAGAVASDTVGR